MIMLDTSNSEPNVLIVIPARLNSERFPRKPLKLYEGFPLVVYTAKQAKATGFKTIVTSPDKEIIQACWDANIPAMPTSQDATSGTDRAAELVARTKLTNNDIIIVWQVDEPEVRSGTVVSMVEVMKDLCSSDINEGPQLATIACDLNEDDLSDENVVKTVVYNNYCFWFSRAPLGGAMAHIGVYGFYGADTLKRVTSYPPGRSCLEEGLEQLAWLENAEAILGLCISYKPRAINIPEDLQ